MQTVNGCIALFRSLAFFGIRLVVVSALPIFSAAGPTLAQSGGVTGSGGCYFGDPDCGDDSDQPPNPQPNLPQNPNPSPSNEPLLCATSFGACTMNVMGGATNASCFCQGMAYGFPAVGITTTQSNLNFTQVPNVASVCRTQFFSCPMQQVIPRFSSCFCPSFGGPVWGQGE